jgi:anti-sigma regulatory factor (Ser/Thr protein kinase)
MNTEAVLLESLTIHGCPEQLHYARAFVANVLGVDSAYGETAVLLASELVSNSLQYSDSRRPGGVIKLILMEVQGGIRLEVADEGGVTIPTLLPALSSSPGLAESGRGLHLVDTLSARWGYLRDQASTVTWFELTDSVP